MATTAKVQKFQIGDIVRLKSGGPEMTVSDCGTDRETYRCQWFAGKKLSLGYFPELALEKVEAMGEKKQ